MTIILEKVAAAILAVNPAELQVVTEMLLDRIRRGEVYCTPPFFIVVDSQPDAAGANAYQRYVACTAVRRWAARSVTGGNFQQRAVAGIVRVAHALSDGRERIVAYQNAATYASPGTTLEAEAEAAFVREVETLPTGYARIEAYQHAANYAARFATVGGNFEAHAVRGFARHVEALPEEDERLRIYLSAIDETSPQSRLQRHCRIKSRLLTQTEDRPITKSEVVNFVRRFGPRPALG